MLNYLKCYLLSKFKQEEGQGMVEYVLLVAFIALVVLVALTFLGPAIVAKFNEITTELGGSTTAP